MKPDAKTLGGEASGFYNRQPFGWRLNTILTLAEALVRKNRSAEAGWEMSYGEQTNKEETN